eukprot:jgi/Psemu1/181266/e_gw1.19.100.1
MAEITSDENDGWEELMGKDLAMKVCCVVGSSKGDTIEPQEAVLISLEGRIAKDRNSLDGVLFQKIDSWLIVVGDADVLPALEMGIRFMKVDQTALIWSHSKFALGKGTRTTIAEDTSANNELKSVPPNSNVMYRVTVRQKVMDTSRLNPYFTIQKALTKKNIANDIYQNEWCKPPKTSEDADCRQAMKRALRLYARAAKEMETLLDGTYFKHVEEDHPQRHESLQILVDSLNNIVAVHMQQKEYHEAKAAAVEVLKIDPNNIKGLLRVALATQLDPASTLEEASAAIKAAESLLGMKSGYEKELKRLKSQLKEKQQNYKWRTKAMFGNKLNSTPSDCKSAGAKPKEADAPISGENKEDNAVSKNNANVSAIILQLVIPILVLLFTKYVYARPSGGE